MRALKRGCRVVEVPSHEFERRWGVSKVACGACGGRISGRWCGTSCDDRVMYSLGVDCEVRAQTVTLILEVVSPEPTAGGASRQTFHEEGGSIGRESDNSWVLPHSKVSGLHAADQLSQRRLLHRGPEPERRLPQLIEEPVGTRPALCPQVRRLDRD